MKNIKEIRRLNKEDLDEFGKQFGNNSFVRTSKVPPILTTSENLQNKVFAVDTHSGTQIGMGFDVYRYDPKDEKREGMPVNIDKYKIVDGRLIQINPPFEGHHSKEVPPFTEIMVVQCKCGSEVQPKLRYEEIPLFNTVRRYSWAHVRCHNCNTLWDIAKLNKKGNFWALNG